MTPAQAAGNRRRRRFDHDQAFAYYAGLGSDERSFVLVAERFGVSDTAVRNAAKAGDWQARVAKLEAKARGRVERSVVRSFEERQRDTIRVAEKARATLLDEDLELDPTAALRTLPRLVHYEVLFAGEATSRVEISDIAPVLDAYNRAILELSILARQVDGAAVERERSRLDDALTQLAAASAAAPAAPVPEPAAA